MLREEEGVGRPAAPRRPPPSRPRCVALLLLLLRAQGGAGLSADQTCVCEGGVRVCSPEWNCPTVGGRRPLSASVVSKLLQVGAAGAWRRARPGAGAGGRRGRRRRRVWPASPGALGCRAGQGSS